jgi:hypothetical protein
MFFALAFLAIAIYSGTVLTFLFDRTMPFPARLCMGTVTGLAIASMTGYLLACGLGLGAACMWVTTAVLLLPSFPLLWPDFRNDVAGLWSRAMRAAAKTFQHPSRRQIAFITF